jgi:alkyl hydroperoxide reductase subunit AhpC
MEKSGFQSLTLCTATAISRLRRRGAALPSSFFANCQENSHMLGVGQKLPEFKIVGVKPGFNSHEENGVSAFEAITNESFEGKWKVIFFYPKDFTFVCPTEIAEFASLARDFDDRDTVVLGGSTDNEFVKLAWRRDHADLSKLPIWQFADNGGKFARDLGVLDEAEGVALRATFVVDPHNVVQHVYVTNLNVGRAPADTLRVVDALQTDELCACNRPVGGETLAA